MWRVLIDMILPRRCHCCGRDLGEKENGICGTCVSNLPFTAYHGRKDNPIEQRLAGKVKFSKAASWLFYSPDSALARLIHDFKYRGFSSLASSLGEKMAVDLQQVRWLRDIDCIMGVPLHWRKQLMRGYCQTHEIARGVSRITGAELSKDLKAFRPHRSQTGMSHEERLHNAEGIFRLQNPEYYEGKRILLIDDVCTTGGTLISAGNAINQACPDCELIILTLATTF